MPSEAQIKAQIQAALAKKKQAAAKPEPSTPPNPPAVPATPPPTAAKPAVEVSTTSTLDRRPTPPVTPLTPPSTPTFAGFPIRVTVDKHQVYFALADLFPLAKDHEWPNKFLDFKNNPKTKAQADDLIKVLTFTNADGSDKTEAATAANALVIMRALNLSVPGPLGRWLREISASILHNLPHNQAV